MTNPILRLSYNDAERQRRFGLVSDRDWREFQFFWLWAAPRFGGDAGRRHDRAHARLGDQRYWRRLARVRALLDRRLAAGPFNGAQIAPQRPAAVA
jgi:hypothetical protein